MSKLWIVHRSPPVRAALLRATGLAPAEVACGAPTSGDFSSATAPSAIVLALGSDCERERDFVHQLGSRVPGARWILLCPAGDQEEVRRVFRALDAVVLDHPPNPHALRAAISTAFARRTTASLTERSFDTRAADRFAAWFGGTFVPGLDRARDPALAALPLLLRGRPGSGRSLLGRHAERARRGSTRRLRIDARDLADLDALASRHAAVREQTGSPVRTLWLDEIDALSYTAQRGLAEWIRNESPPGEDASGSPGAPLRWIATAGPAGLEDRLEAILAQAFAPIVVHVPALDLESGEIARLAEFCARDFAEQVGGVPRVFSESALEALADEPWWGDRAELEAVLRTTLAAPGRGAITASDLRFPGEPAAPAARSERPTARPTADVFPLAELPIDPALDPSSELTALSEHWLGEQPVPARFERADSTPPEARAPSPDPTWRKLARSLSHEIRNPLVSIRTFTELLPDHYADETFRLRFKELVGKDVAHIQGVLTRLSKAAERDELAANPVDVSALIERLLAARRERIVRGRLLVLSELERDEPLALGDADALEVALAGLIDRALDSLPERGDLFIASHRIERVGDGRPRLRVLLRHHDPLAEGGGGELDPVNHILEYVLAETIVSALGGRLTIDPTQGPETLILIDLPTPGPTPSSIPEPTLEPKPEPAPESTPDPPSEAP